MDVSKNLIFRVGLVAVAVFFIFAAVNYIYYHYILYQYRKNPESTYKNSRLVFIMFVSSLAGALFFLMVTFIAYWFLNRPIHP